MTCTVSVVIPVRGDADELERCLEALWLQTRRPDEIVVVDNDSDDLTRAVISWWKVTYVFEKQHGIAAAAAAGYDAASGSVIARLDADSIPPQDWLARVSRAFDDDEGLCALTGPGVFESLPGPLRRAADLFYMRAYFRMFGRLIGRPPVFGSNFAMTREAWDFARTRVHRDDREVHDDLDLSYVLAPGSRVVLDDELRVSVSSRPFAHPLKFVQRITRGMHTIAVNRTR